MVRTYHKIITIIFESSSRIKSTFMRGHHTYLVISIIINDNYSYLSIIDKTTLESGAYKQAHNTNYNLLF